ncbi:TMEM175 family protein [Micromonospora phytophila]|uniref:TMEM175 family protein n=1 Tax=Micromonospora phytophila TaxID=709888 RepID=UPI00202F01DE|nr:TMEM175 family protein [Micromonospora phytophila]MCM0675247.1 TMEM175 family protein [Micromonospora phytophila]
MSRTRLEVFSDAVFAVAITLLALNLAVAGPGHGPLLHQVADHWPSFVAYLISFATIGLIWINHHALVQNVAVVDRTLALLNLVLLVFVVLIPVDTATVAEYLALGGQDARVAVLLYAAAFMGMGFSFAGIFEWTLRSGRLRQPLPKRARWKARLRFGVASVLYLAAVAVAFVSPPVALAIIAAVPVYYIFERLEVVGSPAGDRQQ